ncbi:hypothetical protein [Gracilibacillus sp. JCM 18860]
MLNILIGFSNKSVGGDKENTPIDGSLLCKNNAQNIFGGDAIQ